MSSSATLSSVGGAAAPSSTSSIGAVSSPLSTSLDALKKLLRVDTFRKDQLKCTLALIQDRRDTWLGFACAGGMILVFSATCVCLGGIALLIEPLVAIINQMEEYLQSSGAKTIVIPLPEPSMLASLSPPLTSF